MELSDSLSDKETDMTISSADLCFLSFSRRVQVEFYNVYI